MRLYVDCLKCKTEISFWTWNSDRVDFKKSTGENIVLTCKKCSHFDKYNIDNVKAKESKIALITSLSFLLIGTPILFITLSDYMFKTNNVYTIACLVTCLTIPSLTFGIMTRNDRIRVRIFNRS
jgi:hypothetical protein